MAMALTFGFTFPIIALCADSTTCLYDFLSFKTHRLVRYEVINIGIMGNVEIIRVMIVTNSLSVMYLPSSGGSPSGRIFAMAGFQSYMKINRSTIINKAEIRYKYPASFSQELPL